MSFCAGREKKDDAQHDEKPKDDKSVNLNDEREAQQDLNPEVSNRDEAHHDDKQDDNDPQRDVSKTDDQV